MRCDDVQLEWRIAAVENQSNESHNRLYELDSLHSSVDSMERAVRELSTRFDDLRYELEETKETNRTLAERLALMENPDEI